MKPILFDGSATTYNDNGLGWLTDCISCQVTEERNGIFEAELEYPITGVHYDLITEGRIIAVSHDEQKDLQPFTIYRISKPISGVVTINARHISYRLNNVIIEPYTASNIVSAFEGFHTYAMTNNPFTFWTDKASSGSFSVNTPMTVRAALGGTQGSILDAFGGGEYEFDNFTVKLHQHRGYNNGVTIRYGKNLTDLEAESDYSGLYNAVVPFWSDNVETVVFGGIVMGDGGIAQEETWTDENGVAMQDENGAEFTFESTVTQVYTMDLSSEFPEAPTVAQLEAKAQTILNNNEPWIPKVNIEIDFVALWQTEEYKNIAPLERVRLCDTVTVEYADLGVKATAKVIKVVWNALTERYDRIELGDAKTTFAETLMGEADQLIEQKLKDTPSWSDMDLAIMNATNLITGGMGGHIVFLYDANQHPTDMLVMDTADVSTAVHVLRINVNGIGFSSNGINGPYTSAWTLNGVFNADFIVAGTMSAARIHGGTLVLGGQNNGNGAITVYDGSGNIIGQWNNSGIVINGGIIRTSDGNRTSAIDSGYTKYYSGKFVGGTPTYIGDIGVMTSFNGTDDKGLGFSLTDDGDYIGWFVDNGGSSYDPVLIYSRDDYRNIDVWADALNVGCNLHVMDGYSLSGTNVDDCTITNSRISDPLWNMNGTNYNGITRSTPMFVLPMGFTSSGAATGWWDAQLTFVHGILVDSTLP